MELEAIEDDYYKVGPTLKAIADMHRITSAISGPAAAAPPPPPKPAIKGPVPEGETKAGSGENGKWLRHGVH